MAALANFAEALVGKDAITAVNQFCQRQAGRPISKEDIEYTDLRISGGGVQTTVKLNCMDGQEFAGEVCRQPKDAKLSAAQQVLDFFSGEIASMSASGPPKKKNNAAKKRTIGEISGGLAISAAAKSSRPDGDGLVDATIGPTSNKGELNTYYSKIIRRVINKGEITYQTGPVVGGGYQAQVSLPGLPPPWNTEVWAGEVCSKKGDAEQSVAGVVLEMIKTDPDLMRAYNQPPKPNTWMQNQIKGGGKGKGKGKGKDDLGGSRYGSGYGSAPSIGFGVSGAADPNAWNQALAYQQYMAQQQQMLAMGVHSGFS